MNSVVLENNFSFPSHLVAKAAPAFPAGSFVETDDLAFEMNGLGRKLVQTIAVTIDDRQVSLGYVTQEHTPYELILIEENPKILGDSFEEITRQDSALFRALHEAFGGSMAQYSHAEMVVAITKAKTAGEDPNDRERMLAVAVAARDYVKRAFWVMKNRMQALVDAPVDWAKVCA